MQLQPLDYCILKLIPNFVDKNFQVVYLTNKRKIINDPVYGFISIPGDFVFDLIEHPWFQRLRNIKQLGLTSFVYPGANHSRFQHGLGSIASDEYGYCHPQEQGSNDFTC